MSGTEETSEGLAVYVHRDEGGEIVSVSRVPSKDHAERCPAAQADVVTFLRRLTPNKAALLESDLSLVRVIEDLIDVLIRKDVLRLTDLPDSVQAKLLDRRKLRGSVRSLSLLSNDSDDL